MGMVRVCLRNTNKSQMLLKQTVTFKNTSVKIKPNVTTVCLDISKNEEEVYGGNTYCPGVKGMCVAP